MILRITSSKLASVLSLAIALSVTLLFSQPVRAQYNTSTSGDWSDTSIWAPTPGVGGPGAGESAGINGSAVVNYDVGASGFLSVGSTFSTSTVILQRSLTVDQWNINDSSTLDLNGQSLTIPAGDMYINPGTTLINSGPMNLDALTNKVPINLDRNDTIARLYNEDVITITQAPGETDGLTVTNFLQYTNVVHMDFDGNATAGVPDWALRVAGDHVADYNLRLFGGLFTHNNPAGMSIHAWLDGGYTYVGDDNPVGAQVNGVPEPSTFALAALGLAGLGLIGWRKTRRNVVTAVAIVCATVAICFTTRESGAAIITSVSVVEASSEFPNATYGGSAPKRAAAGSINGVGCVNCDADINNVTAGFNEHDNTSWHETTGGMWMTVGNVFGTPNRDPHIEAADGRIGHIVYDLGAVYNVDSFRVWNFNEAAGLRGIKDAIITVSPSSTLTGLPVPAGAGISTLATNLLTQANGSSTYKGTLYTEAFAARYVRIDAVTHWGGADFIYYVLQHIINVMWST